MRTLQVVSYRHMMMCSCVDIYFAGKHLMQKIAELVPRHPERVKKQEAQKAKKQEPQATTSTSGTSSKSGKGGKKKR